MKGQYLMQNNRETKFISAKTRQLDYPNMIFSLYCNASAKCLDWISSRPARSG